MSSASQTQLGLVYQQHHSWLYKVLARRLNDHFEAADIAHDVFYKLLVKPRAFATSKDTRNYLSHVAKGLYTHALQVQDSARYW